MTSVIYIIVVQSFNIKNQISSFWNNTDNFDGRAWASTLVNYLPIMEETSETRTAFAFNQKRNGVGLGATKNSAFETCLRQLY